MGTEIERKFLVANQGWGPAGDGVLQRQGYLSINEHGNIRVRIAGGTAVLTLKSSQVGLTRAEFSYEIPLAEGEEILEKLGGLMVEKTRYRRPFGEHVWEIDIFHGANEGLVTAEVEMASEEEPVQLPPWIGKDVSHDVRFRVAYLAEHPYASWQDAASS